MSGERLERATRSELVEAHRLWVVHTDIREGLTSSKPVLPDFVESGR